MVLGFVVIVATIRLQGYGSPTPFATLFSNPDGVPCRLPCLFGIRPAETGFDDAIKIIRSHRLLGISQPYKIKLSYTGSPIEFSGAWVGQSFLSSHILRISVYKDDDDKVSQIKLDIAYDDILTSQTVDQSLLSLAEAINVLGLPTPSLDRYGFISTIFYFQNNSIMVNVIPTEFKSKRGLYEPHLTDRINLIEVTSPYEVSGGQLKWCGFTSRICE